MVGSVGEIAGIRSMGDWFIGRVMIVGVDHPVAIFGLNIQSVEVLELYR